MKRIYLLVFFCITILTSCTRLRNSNNDSFYNSTANETSSSSDSILTERDKELIQTSQIFDDLESQYTDLKTYKFNEYPNTWNEGDLVKLKATFVERYDASKHYLFFETQNGYFYINASKIYLKTSLVEGDTVYVYGITSNYHSIHRNNKIYPELELEKIYIDN